jgi:hypothetical protein
MHVSVDEESVCVVTMTSIIVMIRFGKLQWEAQFGPQMSVWARGHAKFRFQWFGTLLHPRLSFYPHHALFPLIAQSTPIVLVWLPVSPEDALGGGVVHATGLPVMSCWASCYERRPVGRRERVDHVLASLLFHWMGSTSE